MCPFPEIFLVLLWSLNNSLPQMASRTTEAPWRTASATSTTLTNWSILLTASSPQSTTTSTKWVLLLEHIVSNRVGARTHRRCQHILRATRLTDLTHHLSLQHLRLTPISKGTRIPTDTSHVFKLTSNFHPAVIHISFAYLSKLPHG